MVVSLNDDLLVRTLKFDGFLECPVGMTEPDLRNLRNQIVGDSHRKKQFIVGTGLHQLMNLAKACVSDGNQQMLCHILTIIASLASFKEAIDRLIDLDVLQLINFVIRSAYQSRTVVLSALKALRNMLSFEPKLEFPVTEIILLAQAGCDSVTEICFAIFSRCTSLQAGCHSQHLVSLCFSRLVQTANVMTYLEYFQFTLRFQFQWNPKEFPVVSFMEFVEHENAAIRLKACQCIFDIPSVYSDLISDFMHLVKKGFQFLIVSLSQKNASCLFSDYCQVLTNALEIYPCFIPEAQPITALLVGNISTHSLITLTKIAANSELFRTNISSSMDFSTLTAWLKHDHRIRLPFAKFLKVLSCSIRPTRMRLIKAGVVRDVFTELASVFEQNCFLVTRSDMDVDASTCDKFQYAIMLTSALANFLIDFNSLQNMAVSADQLSVLVKGTRSKYVHLRKVACLALKNFSFNACFSKVVEITNVISLTEMQLLLEDSSEQVQFHAIGLIKNILLPETNRIYDSLVVFQVLSQFHRLLSSMQPTITLEALSALVNIASGFKDRKILVLRRVEIIESVIKLFDHNWPEIRLLSTIFFENLFAPASIYKKKRLLLDVPIDQLLALEISKKLTEVQGREKSRGNFDAEMRASRAAAGAKRSLHRISEVLQES